MESLAKLYDELCERPFPTLGKSVGHFPLWDSYFSGYVSTYLQGGPRPAPGALDPDDESAAHISALRQRPHLTTEEKEFLDYVGLMERIRSLVHPS